FPNEDAGKIKEKQEGSSLVLVVSGNWGRVMGMRKLYWLQMSPREFPAGFIWLSIVPAEIFLSIPSLLLRRGALSFPTPERL
ncbi:hypothetical protein ACQP3L_37890, partial [Escherichia coli]